VTDPREPIEVRNLVGEPMTVAAVENARTLLIGYGLDPVANTGFRTASYGCGAWICG